MAWYLLALGIFLGVTVLCVLSLCVYFALLVRRHMGVIVRIFEEQPLFIIPRGQPLAGSEEVRFPTSDGLSLAGSYLQTPAAQRRGVVLFCPEFGSNRWACAAYCAQLRVCGFDVFTFEFRNQGESEEQPGYDPLQWVTDYERTDVEAAIAYLKQRPDADAQGIGLFGISRGGGAGILAASREPWVRCVVTDGAFSTRTTMLPYMKKWVAIYARRPGLARLLPTSFYLVAANLALRQVAQKRNCAFPGLALPIRRLSPRPLLMIHGGADTYIKPEIARELFERAREPRTFWLVPGAKHNQALHVAGEQYHQRLVGFFAEHLCPIPEREPAPQLAPVG